MEEALDELNEEFFRLSAQALELQKKDGKLDQLSLGEDNTSMVSPTRGHLSDSSVHRRSLLDQSPLDRDYDQNTQQPCLHFVWHMKG